MAASHALAPRGGDTESWGSYAGRKLGQITSAAALVKGAVDTGRALATGARVAAPYLAQLAPLLAVA